MVKSKIILLCINIIGGVSVIGSYIFGINAQPAGADALWGGVPENIRVVYTVSMFIAAAGYFAFLYYILVKINLAGTGAVNAFSYGVFHLIFIAILLPSALWMPLTNLYLANPGPFYFAGVVLVLAMVGIGSLCLLMAILKLRPVYPGLSRWLAIAGSAYFTFHTLVLDAVIWPVLFLQ